MDCKPLLDGQIQTAWAQDDVPRLFRRVADALEGYGKVEGHDLVLNKRVTTNGGWPSVTVYFSDAHDA